MTPTAIIVTALAIISGNPNQMELDEVLGEHKNEIIQQVQELKGKRLTQIRETIDILSDYNLDLKRKDLIQASNFESKGVSYSTDPPEDVVLFG